MNPSWKHVHTILDGESFELNGLNIWDYPWQSTGEHITVKDPLYGQEHRMEVFEIIAGTQSTRFAAGEFSNCVWGIYQQV